MKKSPKQLKRQEQSKQQNPKRFTRYNIKDIIISLLLLTLAIATITIYWQVNSGGTYKQKGASEVAKTTLWFDEFKINTTEPDGIQKEEEEELAEENEVPEKEVVQQAVIEKPEPTSNWWDYPDPILSTTKSGDNLLVLVNKQYQLPSTYVPTDLVTISGVGCRQISQAKTFQARTIVISELTKLCGAANTDNIDLSIVSAYRSFATQQSTYQYWVNYNGGGVAGIAAADTVSARPGHSQHQLGTALDFSTSAAGDRVGSAFHGTTAANWLEENAWKYGFVLAYPKGYETTTGYSYESWHFRYVGVGNAKIWKESGQILEIWLRSR